jgi:hypothetical protein
MAYEEEQARIFASMSTIEYDALPGTPMWIDPNKGSRSKCHIIMLYRMSNAIPAALNDAQGREMERQSRRPHH